MFKAIAVPVGWEVPRAPRAGGEIVAEELARWGWEEAELVKRRKGDPDKLAIAVRLRKETTLTIRNIAARLNLGRSRSGWSC